MEVRSSLKCLQEQNNNVFLPGGCDREGRPLVLVILSENSPSTITPQLQYILSIFGENTRSKGLTIIIDSRKTSWKEARIYIKQVIKAFCIEELGQIIVLRPDAFWDKQRMENCTNTDKKVISISKCRLSKFVDQSQLPLELGGDFIYNHEKWIEHRQRVDEFNADMEITLKDVEELHEYLINSKTKRYYELKEVLNTSLEMKESTNMLVLNVTEMGRQLLQTIESDNRTRKLASDFESMSTPQDTIDTIANIDFSLTSIDSKMQEINKIRAQIEETYTSGEDLSTLEEGIGKVINLILGPAEELLNAHQKIGYDTNSAEEVRREHESIELQCWSTYGAYAELIHKIENFPRSEYTCKQFNDLLSQKDFMDFVCRSFALRLEKRRNVLITSARFYRLVSEYFDKTTEVFDDLVIGPIAFSTASTKLQQLQENQTVLSSIERELVREGEKLSDMLSMPIKDAMGRELAVDYSEVIDNVNDILDATAVRKGVFDDSVEMQKIMLEQTVHIYGYETDVNQAIQWLDELFLVLLNDYGHVGCTVNEIQTQKNEHLNFQETAKDTYNYGCQLLNASLQLRQSCKLPLGEQEELSGKLKYSWQRLFDVIQEQMTRLRVSAVFHRSVEEHCNQLRDLRETVATIPLMDTAKKMAKIKMYFGAREKLMVEVGRMVRLGKMLRSRLKDPLCGGENFSEVSLNDSSSEDSFTESDHNKIAIEAISERLTEVTSIAEELDQELRSAQQDCSILYTWPRKTATEPQTTTSANKYDTSTTTTSAMDDVQGKKVEELKSDEEFATASECTLQHSRSSSYNTASECENRYSPWWEFEKNQKIPENLTREKMLLAVGQPEVPPSSSVLKLPPELPPNAKIVREVIETTHIKVQQAHTMGYTMGVSSFVLTSEKVSCNDKTTLPDIHLEEQIEIIVPEKNESSMKDDLLKQISEVSDITAPEDEPWKLCAAKQAIKSLI